MYWFPQEFGVIVSTAASLRPTVINSNLYNKNPGPVQGVVGSPGALAQPLEQR